MPPDQPALLYATDAENEALGRLAHETMREYGASRAAQGFNSRWRDTPWEDLPAPTRAAYRVVARAVARAARAGGVS
jgi:hypothetical protein